MRGLQILASVLLLAAFCKCSEAEEEEMKEVIKMARECAEEQDITKEQMESIPRMICAGEALDKKLSCHMACFYKKLGVMENGEILTDEVKKSILSEIDKEDVKKELEGKLDICKNGVAGVADDCDKAVEFTKCLVADTEHCKKV